MFEAGPHLDPAAFKALDPALVQILDVREPWEYDRAHLPGALLIPLGELADRVAELDPGRPLAAYCHHGMRSLQALRFLKGVGFADLAHLAGGIDAYSRMDPTVPRY
ncbi:MAG: sulfurtransferase [Geothrix sp.]|uniref:rhodanese-like domain-containing protein n=1 Tax=Geothrix sp. TaxID=1962974 RepID=UPI0018217A36|nr:rhodanese-like domain-containing protein [Geothrix sp.]NWJ39522.1 sulfurtransferase [Geothrix sp.]WIL19257.1 MAG: rhodanese-like domain-containing protein [Geothrix sp.]